MELLNVTLNPNDMNGAWTLTNGDLTATIAAGTPANIRATHGKVRGKWYWEVKFDSGSNALFFGIANKLYPITSGTYTGSTEDSKNLRMYYGATGNKYPESVAYGSGWATGNTVGVALDLDNSTLEFYKNGVSMGVSHTDLQDIGEVFPIFKGGNTTTRTFTVNFGTTPFTYPIPVGYKPYVLEYTDKILLVTDEGKVKSIGRGGYSDSLIPSLTSNTSALPIVVDASGYQSGFDPYKAFDGKTNAASETWQVPKNTDATWLSVDFGSKKMIRKYSITGLTTSRSPTDWTFEGSNTGLGSDWDILDAQMGQVGWASGETREFRVNGWHSYRYFRINITANNGDATYIMVSEFKLYEYYGGVTKALDDTSEQSFIDHGMTLEDLTLIDPTGEFTEKHYIVSQSTPLGAGKVFTQPLDVDKVIKRVTIV